MVKIITKLAFIGTLLLASGIHAMKAVEKVFPLSKDTTWLVHATHVFPQNGCVIAGSLLQMKFADGSNHTNNPLIAWYEQAAHVCTAWRNTVHWSVNSLVYPHNFRAVTTDGIQNLASARDAYPYIIIEPLKAFKGTDLHGYWQDVYQLGGHQLSPDAIILVSAKDTGYKDFVGTFKGTIMCYNADQREAVELLLAKNEAPVLYPCMRGISVPKGLWWHQKGQQVLLNGEEISPVRVAELLALDNVLPLETLLGQVHKGLGEFLMEVRSLQLISSLWSQLLPHEDQLGLHRCVTCKTEKDKTPAKKLLACSACHQATYCSGPCQKAHWAHHKTSCPLLKGCVAQVNQLRGRYVAQCQVLGGRTFNHFMQDVQSNLDRIAQGFPAERERRIMANYRQYITLLLSVLYSPEAEYAEKRAAFNIDTIEGFIAFAKEVRRMVAPYETLIGEDVILQETCSE